MSSRTANNGWRRARDTATLPEVFASVKVPLGGPWWRRLLGFFGPGYMVAVGYMDPGNWATDLAGGSQFAYALLSVILISNVLAGAGIGIAATDFSYWLYPKIKKLFVRNRNGNGFILPFYQERTAGISLVYHFRP